MSKKKSYMDRKNILSENKLFKLLNKLIPFSKLIKKSFTSKEKDALKDPKVKKAFKDFDRAYEDAIDHADKFKKMIDDYKPR